MELNERQKKQLRVMRDCGQPMTWKQLFKEGVEKPASPSDSLGYLGLVRGEEVSTETGFTILWSLTEEGERIARLLD